MARWIEIAQAQPELTTDVKNAFDAFTHKTVATLRKNGSPRISGTEARFFEGDLWFGSMPEARKARDLLRDPRFALHGGTGTAVGTDWPGDAKVAGRAVEVTDDDLKNAVFRAWSEGGDEVPEGPSHLFRADLTEVVFTSLNEAKDALVVRIWTEQDGFRTVERK